MNTNSKNTLLEGMNKLQNRPKLRMAEVQDEELQKETATKKTADARKVISIAYPDYKRIKNYANEHDISITAAVSMIVENSTII